MTQNPEASNEPTKPWEPPQELMDKYIEAVKAAPDNLWQRWHDHEGGIKDDRLTLSEGRKILNKIAPDLNNQEFTSAFMKLRGIIFYTARNLPFPENF